MAAQIWDISITTDPALQSVGMSFLSGNLSVLSGSRETLYTTQHSRYYELYYFTSYISLFSLTTELLDLYMDAPLKIFTTRFNRVHNLSSPRYKADSSLALSSKLTHFQLHPPLNILTVPDWLNFKFLYFLIGPKVEILNTVTRLASIYVTLFHCHHPCEPLHASY